jgi:hypothetical protein
VRFATATILIALLVTAGCGPRTTTVPANLTAGLHTRCMAPGDELVFNVTVERIGETTRESDRGMITKTIEAGTSHGPSYKGAIAQTVHVVHRGQDSAGTRGRLIHWYGQNPSGAVYFLGRRESGAGWAVVKNAPQCQDVPPILTGASSWGYTARLTNGHSETISYKIVRLEKVTTPAGVFEAYKTQWSETKADGTLMSGYLWIRPEFPLGIKTDTYITSPAARGKSIHVVESLRSYHLMR